MIQFRQGFIFPFFLIMLGSALLLQSCASAYRPTAINMPFLKEEGDLLVGVSAGSNNADAQAAYAITDRFSMLLAYSRTRNSDSANMNRLLHYNFEIAPGFHAKMGENYLFNAFAGYSTGRIENYSSGLVFNNNTSGTPLFSAKGRYSKQHLQASIAFVSDFLDISIDNKLLNIHFPSLMDADNQLLHRGHNQFYELGYTFRAGFKAVKFSHQLSTVFKLNNQINYSYNFIYTNLGIHIDINTLKIKESMNSEKVSP